MTVPPFAVTWDYRCPFARIAHEHVVTALQAGAGWDVQFVPFSLDEPHTEEGQPSAFDDPARLPAQLAGQVGIAVRDHQPEAFLSVHRALFAARHDLGLDITDPAVLAKVVDEAGGDGAAALADVDQGWTLEAYRKEHHGVVEHHDVFGVPTFIVGDDAVFVRLMNRPEGDAALATSAIERVVSLVAGWPDLNEFKHTSITR